jgi:hypothetical protein
MPRRTTGVCLWPISAAPIVRVCYEGYFFRARPMVDAAANGPFRQMPRCKLMSASGVLRKSWNATVTTLARSYFTALFRKPKRAANSYLFTFAKTINCRAPGWCEGDKVVGLRRASVQPPYPIPVRHLPPPTFLLTGQGDTAATRRLHWWGDPVAAHERHRRFPGSVGALLPPRNEYLRTRR